jgi:hypothetical protein
VRLLIQRRNTVNIRSVLIPILLAVGCLYAQTRVSIPDVQRTSLPGFDSTYPSPYTGKTITVSGIVTAIGFEGGSFFISTPSGGAWSGLCIRSGENVEVGEYLEATGVVTEAHGFTMLDRIRTINRLGTRQLPKPTRITTSELNRGECYESVLVQVDITTNTTRSSRHISGSSSECRLDSGFASVRIPDREVGTRCVTGISVYAFGEYRLNPRTNSDISSIGTVNAERSSWGRVKSLYK